MANPAFAHRAISHRRADHRGAASAAPSNPRRSAQGGRRARQQPQERHRRNPARPVHLRHRRLGRRQVDARWSTRSTRRSARKLNGASRGPCPARPHRGARAPRQGHRHRPVADRPHAALQPGHLHRRLHADPRMVRRPAGGQGARLRAGPLLASTSRAGAARPARATASSRSRCTSCPTSTSPATSARASATTARRWRSSSRASRSPTCST